MDSVLIRIDNCEKRAKELLKHKFLYAKIRGYYYIVKPIRYKKGETYNYLRVKVLRALNGIKLKKMVYYNINLDTLPVVTLEEIRKLTNGKDDIEKIIKSLESI